MWHSLVAISWGHGQYIFVNYTKCKSLSSSRRQCIFENYTKCKSFSWPVTSQLMIIFRQFLLWDIAKTTNWLQHTANTCFCWVPLWNRECLPVDTASIKIKKNSNRERESTVKRRFYPCRPESYHLGGPVGSARLGPGRLLPSPVLVLVSLSPHPHSHLDEP